MDTKCKIPGPQGIPRFQFELKEIGWDKQFNLRSEIDTRLA